MYSRMAVAALTAVSFAAPVIAQQPTAYDKTQDGRIDDIARQVAALTTRMTTAENNIASNKSELEQKLENLAGTVQTLRDAVADQKTSIGQLNSNVNAVEARIKSQLDLHEQILKDVSVKDGGHYVPNVSSAMSSSDKFRQDMDSAVHKSLKTGGTLLLINKTAMAQWVDINRTRYFLRPGEQLPVAVNVGTVTTQLLGEEMQTWTITAPAYQLSLDIVPKPAPTPTVVASPVYFGTPRYISPPLAETPVSLGSSYYSGSVEVAYR